jgi:hypothetical protein
MRGTPEIRIAAGVGAASMLAVLIYALWPYIAGAGVIVAAWRVMHRGTRRRRPRSSWSALGRTAALMYAAWNSRWLRVDRKATVPAKAVTTPDIVSGNELVDDGVPY